MEMKMGESILSRKEAIAKSLPHETGSTDRVRKLNAILLSRRPRICLHRARAYTEVFSQTEGEPTEIRFAKAFAKTLHDMPPVIAEGELIVGVPTCRIRSAVIIPEIHGAWLRNEIDTLSSRQWDPYEVSPQQVEEAKEILHYWQGRTLFDLWAKACPSEIAAKVIGKGWADSVMAAYSNGFHFTPPWELILSNGLAWYEAQGRDALARIDYTDPEQMGKNHFYQALLLVIAVAAIAGV